MSLIEKIDERIAVYKDKQNNTDYAGSIAYQNIINGLNDAKQIILSEQKDTKPICKIKDTNCTGYKDGKCQSIENCYGKVEQPVITIDKTSQKKTYEYPWKCPVCNMEYITEESIPKNKLTIGDKIRESNENLAEFALEVQSDTEHGEVWGTVERCEQYLNQPYTEK